MNVVIRKVLIQTSSILVLAIVLGIGRQFFPHGIKWNGQWPTAETSAEKAYDMMAEEGDPEFISLAEVIDLQRKGEAIFLDARASDEFEKGRIPGARALPYYQLDDYHAKALEGVAAQTPLVIYCEGIGCELSFFLGRELQTAGYRNIRIFYGGYPEWQKAGLPIEE